MSHTDDSETTIQNEQVSIFDQLEIDPTDDTDQEPLTRYEQYKWKLNLTVVAPLKILLSDWRGKIGLGLVSAFLVIGIVGPFVVDPPSSDLQNRLVTPFQMWQYPLGTNHQGHDLMALTIHGTPPILKMVASGAVFATVVGAIIGMVSGYKLGLTDVALTTFTDALMTLPGLPLVIVISFVLMPESPYVVGIIIAINAWTGLARSIRSQMLTLRDSEHVEAARFMGVPLRSIMLKDITPHLMPYVLVNFMNNARNIIFASVALYFLGILPFSQSNWGVVMNNAYTQGALTSMGRVHWIIVPMVALSLFSLGLILLAQAADRVFNPRIRAKHVD